MRVMPQDTGTLHFVGIGGIGMSGIAEILHELGYKVQGSDLSDGPNIERLRKKGLRVFTGHDPAHIKNEDGSYVDAVVISSAIKSGNPELEAARLERLPVVRRAEMLAELMRLKKAVVIGGTHGKTTTTSMVGAMLEEGTFDPTVINGGIVNRYGTNVRLGHSEWMVAEADESDGTFTALPSSVAVITNIDPEHMEFYGSFDNVRKAYKQFVMNLPFFGYAVLCGDHPEVRALLPEISDRRLITYGFNPQVDVRATDLRIKGQSNIFAVTFSGWIKGGEDVVIEDIELPMLGEHNVLNALAALVIGYEMGMSATAMREALANFGGVRRRFSKTGEVNGISVIDDYAHHPVEIEAVLKAGQAAVTEKKGRVIAVMQPHRYSRLADLFDEFAASFTAADSVIIADVYEAGERPVEGIDKEHLAEAIKKQGHKDVHLLEAAENLPQLIADIAKEDDFVLCLGAGDITKWAQNLPSALEAIIDGKKGQAA